MCCVIPPDQDLSSLTVSKLVESSDAAAHEKTNNLLADIGTFFDFVLNMVGEVVAIVIDTPLLLLSVVITLCGIGIVFLKRLI